MPKICSAGKHDCARRYISKAASVENMFGAAWLAYGHAFAADNEHDQAMAAYFKASHLMKGWDATHTVYVGSRDWKMSIGSNLENFWIRRRCYLPLLYIGLECGLTSNTGLANRYFQEAKLLAPKDPFVMHEMGVIAYQNHRYWFIYIF